MYIHNFYKGLYMVIHKNLSNTEEMYLVTIHKICEGCTDEPVSIPEIARELGVQPVSANQMVNKLTESGFVEYTPYKGVKLTRDGRTISTRTLRHRRLWEVFLFETLKMDLDTVDQLACAIEHSTSREVAGRLEKHLGDPKVCYHGKPIPPDDESNEEIPEGISLKMLKTGQSGHVIQINCKPAIKKFLLSEGIRPGTQISLLAIGNNDAFLLKTKDRHIHLSAEVVGSIQISC